MRLSRAVARSRRPSSTNTAYSAGIDPGEIGHCVIWLQMAFEALPGPGEGTRARASECDPLHPAVRPYQRKRTDMLGCRIVESTNTVFVEFKRLRSLRCLRPSEDRGRAALAGPLTPLPSRAMAESVRRGVWHR